MEKLNFVLLEQVQDAIVVLLDDGILAPDHLGNVQAQTLESDAVIGEVVCRLFVIF